MKLSMVATSLAMSASGDFVSAFMPNGAQSEPSFSSKILVRLNRHPLFISSSAADDARPITDSENFDETNKSSPTSSLPRPKPSEARLTMVQITDVYTLENFPHLKTLLQEKRADLTPGSQVVSVLTGDFLAPYLLSSVDGGSGMMQALAATPVDYLTWGNHEADIPHLRTRDHVRRWADGGGKWINSNMQDYSEMKYQLPYDVITVTSEDGTNTRKIGLVAVLSDDPSLYEHFEKPGAFGGATIDDPWETLRKYKELLEDPDGPIPGGCDVVVPLQHMYCPDDHKTCRDFDFPVILSGHDHHVVDETIAGTRLLKAGADGVCATLLDLSWENAETPSGSEGVRVNADIVEVDQWKPDAELAESCHRAYDALDSLRNTELARIPPRFEPLSSTNARGEVCTMGRFICSLLLSAINTSPTRRHGPDNEIDAVLLMGGNIRGGSDYNEGSFFSLEALEAEVKEEEVVAVVPMPGWLLSEGVAATHAGAPIPGWMQYDEGVIQDKSGAVTHVGGYPIDPDRIYRVATKISDLTNGQSKPWTQYFTSNPEKLPAKGAFVVNVRSELMAFFARSLGRRIWEAISLTPKPNAEECATDEELFLCRDLDDPVSVDEIHDALSDVLGMSVDQEEQSLARVMHGFIDANRDGEVTLRDFVVFRPSSGHEAHEIFKWRNAFPQAEGQSAQGQGRLFSSLPMPAIMQ